MKYDFLDGDLLSRLGALPFESRAPMLGNVAGKHRSPHRGSYMASLEDLEAVAPAVLTHRVLTNFAAESQGMTSKKIIERLIEEMREA